MRGNMGQFAASGQKRFVEVARFQTRQPHAPQPVDAGNPPDQLGQARRSAVPGLSDGGVVPEGAEEHARQDDLPVARRDQAETFGLDLVDGSGPDPRSHVRHDTVGAERIAPVLHLHEGPLVGGKVVDSGQALGARGPELQRLQAAGPDVAGAGRNFRLVRGRQAGLSLVSRRLLDR